MSFPPLFDTENPNPYASLAAFTNRQVFLPDVQKKEFLLAVEKYFSEQAFHDRACPPTGCEVSQVKYDIETLKKLISEFEERQHAHYRHRQLLANISKVAGLALSEIHQLIIHDAGTPLLWGWIQANYVSGSPKLTAALKDGCVALNLADVKPTVLFALQRLCQVRESRRTLELSHEAFFDLVRFAIHWEVKPLQEDLKIYLTDSKDRMYEQERKAFEVALKCCDQETIAALTQLNKTLPTSTSELSFHSTQTQGDSSCFNVQQPYASIIRFSARCAALSASEQNRFISSVNIFFANAALNVQTVEIPQNDERMFSRLAFPFLLSAMRLKETDRQRLIACVQIVSKREFLGLNHGDHVRIVHNHGPAAMPARVKTTWVGVEPPKQGDQATQPLRPIEVDNLEQLTSRDSTAEQLIKWFLFATENSVPTWRESVLAEIKARLKFPGKPRDEMSIMLVRHLHCLPIRAAAADIADFRPNRDSLNDSELYDYLKFRIANQDKRKIVSILSNAEVFTQRGSVLARLMAEATPSEKEGIQEHYLERIIHYGNMGFKGHDEIGRALLPLLFSKDRKREDIVRALKDLNNVEGSCRTCYRYFLSDLTVRDCKTAGLEAVRVQAVSVLEEVFPHFVVIPLMQRFLQEFFPDLVDSRIPRNSILQQMLENLCKRPVKPFKANSEIALCSEEEVVSTFKVLQNARVKSWLAEHAPQINYDDLVRCFDETYAAESTTLSQAIEQEVLKTDPANEHTHERSLIYSFHVRQNDLKTLMNLGIKITSPQAYWIKDVLSKEEVKVLVQRKLGYDAYKQMLQLLEKICKADALADTFAASLSQGPYREIMKEIYKGVFIQGDTLINTTIHDLIAKYFGAEDTEGHLVRIALLFETPEVKVLCDEVAVLLTRFFVQHLGAPVLVYADIHVFLEAVKDQLSEQEAPILKKLLIDQNNLMGFNRPELERALKPTELANIRRCLQGDVAKTHLLNDKLPRAVNYLIEQLQQYESSNKGLLSRLIPKRS